MKLASASTPITHSILHKISIKRELKGDAAVRFSRHSDYLAIRMSLLKEN